MEDAHVTSHPHVTLDVRLLNCESLAEPGSLCGALRETGPAGGLRGRSLCAGHLGETVEAGQH